MPPQRYTGTATPAREEEHPQAAPSTHDVEMEFDTGGGSMSGSFPVHRGWASLRDDRRGLGSSSPVALLAQQWLTSHIPTTQIQDIATIAADVFGDEHSSVKWLSEPNLATDNRAPIELMGEKDGFERVKNLLMRIEYGVLA